MEPPPSSASEEAVAASDGQGPGFGGGGDPHSVSAAAGAAAAVAEAEADDMHSSEGDPEAGLPPAAALAAAASSTEADEESEGPAVPSVARMSSWRRVVHWAVGPKPHPKARSGGGGWTGPDGERRSEERVFRALLCLMDAGEKRRPTIAIGPPGREAAPMRYYYLRRTQAYSWFLRMTCLLYLSISLSEVPDFHAVGPHRDRSHRKHWRFFAQHPQGKLWWELLIEVSCVVAFTLDIIFQALGSGAARTLRYRWTHVFIVCLVFDVIGMVWPVLRVLVVSGIVRCYPIIYYNQKARNAVTNYFRALPSVLQWIASELFLITVYACTCVLLYSDMDRAGRSGQDAFLDFGKAFISLYSLSLTVNDPDVYLPYYRVGFWNAMVFASFLVLTYFMIHNIILARIFQIYSTKLKETALKRNGHRQQALMLAFDALDEGNTGRLPRGLVAHVLHRLKPHYSEPKLQTLIYHANKDNPDEEDTRDYNFDQFGALMVSVVDDRLHRIRPAVAHAPPVQRALDLLAVAEFALVVVAIARFRQVFYSAWVWWLLLAVRVVFTVDLAYRACRYKEIKYFMKNGYHKLSVATLLISLASGACMLHAIFGTGVPGVLPPGGTPESRSTSQRAAGVLGLVVCTLDVCGVTARLPEYAALLTVVGRLFIPAFLGQAVVVFTLLHVFTYIGMYIFGGRVDPSQALWAEKPFPGNLYFLLNFNTYKEGMMTLFNLLVVNNWNVISGNFAQVMETGAAYVFFMLFQMLVTTTALACVTSFFITHLSSRMEEELERQHLSRQLRKHKHGRQDGPYGPSDRTWTEWASWPLGLASSAAAPRRDDRLSSEPEVATALERGASEPPPQRYRMERRLSSGFLVLADDEPVDAAEYRALLEAMTKETGDRTGYCFVKETHKGQAPEIVIKSSLFSKIVSPYRGEPRILHLCARVFAREASRRERGLTAIVGSETQTDVSLSAAAAAAAAAATSAAQTEPTESESGLAPVMVAARVDSLQPANSMQRDTYFCLEETHPHPTTPGLRLYFKAFFITERESMLSYVHVEEERVGELTMGAGGVGKGRSPRQLQPLQQPPQQQQPRRQSAEHLMVAGEEDLGRAPLYDLDE